MMKIFTGLSREVGQHLPHFVGERARVHHPVLRSFELRRRDHLHGLGDLLGVLNRLDTPADVQEICHSKKAVMSDVRCPKSKVQSPMSNLRLALATETLDF